MTDVNPELVDDNISKLRDRVNALFASRADTLVKSVARFLQANPGSLDHQNLRVIATAAPHIGDPALVARLIDELPITHMHVAAKSFDIASDREKLGRIFSDFSNKTRINLLADLVRQNTIDFLTFCPPERMTDEGRALIEDHLLVLAKGDQQEQANAVASPFVTPAVVDAVLNRVEQRIVRSERGTTNRVPGPLPLDLVADGLIKVLDRDTDVTTREQVTRAWSLARRCEPGDVTTGVHLLKNAVTNSKLDENTAHSVLDAVIESDSWPTEGTLTSWLKPSPYLLSGLISTPEMPDSAVRRAFDEEIEQDAAFAANFPAISLKWRLFRLDRHRSKAGEELPPPTESDVDRWVAQLPAESISRSLIEEMKDPDALTMLGKRAGELNGENFTAVLDNDHTPKRLLTDLLSSGTSRSQRIQRLFLGRQQPGNYKFTAISNHRLSDDEIVSLLQKLDRHHSGSRIWGQFAALNPSAGPKVFDYLRRSDHNAAALKLLANTSANPDVHRLIVDLASEKTLYTGDSVLGRVVPSIPEHLAHALRSALADNGTVSDEVAGEFRRRETHRLLLYPIHEMNDDPARIKPGHFKPIDVARRLITDGRVAGDAHFGEIMWRLSASGSGFRQDAAEAALAIADADLLDISSWEQATAHVDRHVAMRFATHQNCSTTSSGLETKASVLLNETVQAIKQGTPLPYGELRQWAQLPNTGDVPFPLPPAAGLIDSQVVDGLKLEVLKTPNQLAAAADYMGNCLSGYADNIRRGTHLVAIARAERDMYASAWTSGSAFVPREINSRHNSRRVPEQFRAGIHELTDKLNKGELRPAVETTPSPPVEPEPSERKTVRPAPRRNGPIELDVGRHEDRDDLNRVAGGPNLLAAGGQPQEQVIEIHHDVIEQPDGQNIVRPELDL